MSWKNLILVCLVVISLLVPGTCLTRAATLYWNVASGNWSDPMNWGGSEPNAYDHANISNGGTAGITLANEACSTLYLGEADSGTVYLSSGSLMVNTAYIGYSNTGSFLQLAGTNKVNADLNLGYGAGCTGSYDLSGTGQLQARNEYVGYSGIGVFKQSAGSNKLLDDYNGHNGNLILGFNAGSQGTYELSGTGSLTVNNFGIGVSGTGLFVQLAGSTYVGGSSFDFPGTLSIGAESDGKGTYELKGGLLSTPGEFVGYEGIGAFNHTAGIHTIGWSGFSSATLYLGFRAGSQGRYNLSGSGNLEAWYEQVGVSGQGEFNHTAGKNKADFALTLGSQSSSMGIYNLSGTGDLTSSTQYVGYSGTGIFNQSGGTNSASLLTLAYETGASGTYNLTKGTLIITQLRKGDGTAAFNFGGGTIKASPNSNPCIDLPMTLTGDGGDANFDTTPSGIQVYGTLSGPGGLNVKGKAVLLLRAANTYTGATTVTTGWLSLGSTASLASPLIDVKSGAGLSVRAVSGGFSLAADQVLRGSGAIGGDIRINGIHAPGNSFGIMTVMGNYDMLGELQIELMGTTAGTGYDQVLLPQSGTEQYHSTLAGLLTLDWTGMTGSDETSKLWILKNDTIGTLSGAFTNYANGDSLGYHDGREWQLWYRADAATGNLTGGNDVVIAAVPEPASILLLGIIVAGLAIAWIRRRK